MGKSVTTEITCDWCGQDLSSTHYMSEYRLELSDVAMGGDGSGFRFATGRHPHLDRTKVFCGQPCLVCWVHGNLRSPDEFATNDALGQPMAHVRGTVE